MEKLVEMMMSGSWTSNRSITRTSEVVQSYQRDAYEAIQYEAIRGVRSETSFVDVMLWICY